MTAAVVEHALARLRAAGADDADAGLVDRETLEVRVRGDEIAFVKQSHAKALRLRAFLRGDGGARTGVATTSDLAADAVDGMAHEAVALARAAEVDACAGLPDGGFETDPPELALFDPADRPWDVDERIEAALRAEAAARAVDPRIANSEGSDARCDFAVRTLGNTRGFLGSYTSSSYGLAAAPVAEADGQKQVASWFTSGRRLADLDDPETTGRTAGERAVRRLGARAVPTCEVPVIFEARVAGSLLMHLFSAATGYALYRKASFLIDRVGDALASPSVSVIDEGRVPGRLGSRPFDNDGLPTRRNELVRNGRLERYLYDTYSARKLGAESTGSAGAAGVGPTNLWLEPGDRPLEALIADTRRGLLVTDLMGFGFNAVTGDYSRGAAGLWIEDGAVAHPVHEVTVAGNLGDMLASVDAVGSDLDWRRPVAAPSLRIARMTVAGR